MLSCVSYGSRTRAPLLHRVFRAISAAVRVVASFHPPRPPPSLNRLPNSCQRRACWLLSPRQSLARGLNIVAILFGLRKYPGPISTAHRRRRSKGKPPKENPYRVNIFRNSLSHSVYLVRRYAISPSSTAVRSSWPPFVAGIYSSSVL